MATKSTTASPIPAAAMTKMISDYQDRFEVAAASGSRLLEHAAAFAKGNAEAAFASTRIAVSGIDAIARNVGKLPMSRWESVWPAMPPASSPAELLRAQAEQASAALEHLLSAGSRLGEAMVKLGFDVAEPLTSRAAAAIADMPHWLER